MRINSITSNAPGRGNTIAHYAPKRDRECVKERDNLKQNNYDNINTSIKSNPDARVSFRGTPFLHTAANFVTDKPLVAEAIFALFITCGLRPLSIMATAKDETEKDKCAYQAAKSISSGIVGLAMTAVIGSHIGDATKNAEQNDVFKMPSNMLEESTAAVNKGIEALKGISETLKNDNKEPELQEQINKATEGGKLNLKVLTQKDENGIKTFKEKIGTMAPDLYETVEKALKEQKVIDNYAKTAKNVADKFFQPVFMPFRAAVTISLIPVLLTTLGLKKPGNKKQETQPNMFNTLNNNAFKDDTAKALFKPFSGVAGNENK